MTVTVIRYSRGGQLVLDWDRLENFLLTRDRPVGNNSQVQNAKVEHTNTIVSDPQKGKVSVTTKSWLLRNKMLTYHNTFAASALLAHGQPSQEAPKIYVINQFMDNFYVLSGIYIESVLYRYLVNSMQIRRDQPTDTRRSTCWPPLRYSIGSQPVLKLAPLSENKVAFVPLVSKERAEITKTVWFCRIFIFWLLLVIRGPTDNTTENTQSYCLTYLTGH